MRRVFKSIKRTLNQIEENLSHKLLHNFQMYCYLRSEICKRQKKKEVEGHTCSLRTVSQINILPVLVPTANCLPE